MADAAGTEWKEYRLRDLFVDVKAGAWGDLPRDESDPLCVRVADFDRQWLRVRSSVPTRRHVGERTFERIALQKGDLLLEKSGGGDKQSVGAVVLWDSDEDAICSNFVARLRVKPGVSARFVCLTLHASYATGSVRRNIKQTTGIQNLDMRGFFSESVTIPSSATQELIVRYLDNADLRISRAIQARLQIVALLRERRRLVIEEHIVRGCSDGEAGDLIQSQVPWLGEVPKSWSLVPFRAIFTRRRKLVGSRSDDFTLLSLTLRGVIRRDLSGMKGKFPASFDTYQVVEPGDLVMCLFDVDETPRTVGISEHEGMITGAYDVFSSEDQQLARFAAIQLHAIDDGKKFKPLYRGLRKVVPLSDLKGAGLVIPPRERIEGIVNAVEADVAATDSALEAIESEIALLREFRTKLVSDVVTGKKDVRAHAASMKDVDPAELADALAGGMPSNSVDFEVNDDAE